jgi:hypothetical protein
MTDEELKQRIAMLKSQGVAKYCADKDYLSIEFFPSQDISTQGDAQEIEEEDLLFYSSPLQKS